MVVGFGISKLAELFGTLIPPRHSVQELKAKQFEAGQKTFAPPPTNMNTLPAKSSSFAWYAKLCGCWRISLILWQGLEDIVRAARRHF